MYYVKVKLVRNTKDFVIANRKIGFGFGVAGLISIWTWAMAVMMSAAQTYSFGLSGLFWFTVPNGLAVIAAIPFVRKIRTLMPDGYTIPKFVKVRFDGNAVAGGVVVLGALFGSLIEVIINIKGTSLVISNVFGADPRFAAIIGLLVVLIALIGFWEWRSAVLMALSMPIALVMTFGMAHLVNIDLQQVSIATLIIALGLLVDNPVVANDAIKRELVAGNPPVIAAWLGPTKLARAILYATLTNIIAYLPFLMLTGSTGDFLHSLPIVMAAALISSRCDCSPPIAASYATAP